MRRSVLSSFLIVVALLVVVASPAAWAEVRLHRLFSDHMVLQQQQPVRVFGWASPGEKVTVKLGAVEGQTTAGKDGFFLVQLPPQKAGGPFGLIVEGKDSRVALQDVMVGEVWVCSGQSNMQWPVSRSANAQQVIANSKNDMLRLFTVERRPSDTPETDVRGGPWQLCGPKTVPGFSAVAYHFGKQLQEKLGVAVGLISSNYGGTPAEAWTSREALAAHPKLKYYLDRPRNPRDKDRPYGLFNAMIHPLLKFPIRGAIWYQGESNAQNFQRAEEYYTLFPVMIQDWRRRWGLGDFPFLFVQLAPFRAKTSQPTHVPWAVLRDAQLHTMKTVPNTAMAVIVDVGDERDIHPRQKGPVGRRLALAALALAYGKDLVYSGPIYKCHRKKGDRIVIEFDFVGSGLVARGGPLTGFTICGPDRKFVNAQAKIEGKTVVVWSPKVSDPVAVRYGWANYPLGNLWNREGLPASPFRTDQFPVVPQGK